VTSDVSMNVLCFVEQKLDEQDSMDTSQNDNTTEHSLPNNSEAADAEVQAFDVFCCRISRWNNDSCKFGIIHIYYRAISPCYMYHITHALA